MELNIPLPITYEEFVRKRYNPGGIRALMIDNVDRLLEYIARGSHISVITTPVPHQILHP